MLDIVEEGRSGAGELAEQAQEAIRERLVKDHHSSQGQVSLSFAPSRLL